MININKLKYLPNWVVLLLDILIVIFSGIITFYIFKELELNYILLTHFYSIFFFYLSVNIFFFLALRTYSGIIRHTSQIDAIKLFLSQFLTFGIIVFIDYFLLYIGKPKIAILTASLLNALLSLGLLLLFRIIVKHIFENFINKVENKNKTNIIIYGLDANAISVANALASENPKRFNIIGFIDKTNENSDKRILNLPIFKLKKSVPLTIRLAGAEAIIIADSKLSIEERNSVVESCITYNFKVFMAPIVSNFQNAENIAKEIKNFEITDLLERNPIVLDTDEIKQRLAKKTILITGAAGSIGSEIVRQILNYDAEKIILIDQAETPLHHLVLELNAINTNLKIETIIADIRNLEISEQIFKKTRPNIVFHAAAYKHVPLMEENPNQAVLTNVLGTKNIADLSLKYHVEDFVMISTDKAVNPSSIMGASKRIAEMYVQSKHFNILNGKTQNATKFITTRFGNVLGSNGSVVPLFTKQIKKGGPITLTHPEVIRYFMTIPEACQLVLEACSMGKGGEIFIFDMGKPVKILDLAKKMIRLAGFKPDIDIKIEIIGLRPGEKLYEELLNESAKNVKTHHEKILIAIEVCEDYITINKQISTLIEEAFVNNYDEIIKAIKQLVPEYKQMN
ncbi:MAG: polysaccharide biosynthesis protein [Flavobacterium sp.]|uniref:polysaccharide biosynthesis protein n=1 Tax=Flavobacterium sp. TaxID=239 RepID=UPI003BBBB847